MPLYAWAGIGFIAFVFAILWSAGEDWNTNARGEA